MKLLKEVTELAFTEEQIQESLKKNNGRLVITGTIQRADALNQNGRIYPRDILQKEINNYIKLVNERRATGELDHCMYGNVEILTTSDGWKKLDQIDGSEEVYTYNTETSEIEPSPILKVHKFHYEGNMLRLTNSKKMDISMTPNHRMIIWDRYNKSYYQTAEDTYELWKQKNSRLSHSCIKSSGIWKGNTPTYFTIPGTDVRVPAKAWAAFLGFWLAEGYAEGCKSRNNKSNKVSVVQKKIENIEKIREMLRATELSWNEYLYKDGKYEWFIYNKDLHSYLIELGDSYRKYIPKEILQWETTELNIMLDWMLLGDGRNRKSPTNNLIKEYSTVSKRLADDVSELIFKLGYRPFIKEEMPSKNIYIENRLIIKEHCHKLYTVCANTTSTSLDCRFTKFEEVPHNDYVYCVSTKNKNFLMRSENGYVCWTGNTDEPVVNLKNVSHVITKIWMEQNGDVLGDIEVLDNLPMGKILYGLLERGVKVGISSRALGSVEHSHEGDIVQDDLHLVCFDMVSDPSTHNAWMSLKEGKEYSQETLNKIFNRSDRIDRAANEILRLNKLCKKI